MDNQKTSVQKNSEEDKIMATFSYIGVLCLIPLLSKKDNAYIQFHAKQGLIIFIIWVAIFFINVIPILGQMIWVLVALVLGIISIMAIVKLWQGEEQWKIPFIYGYSKKVKL